MNRKQAKTLTDKFFNGGTSVREEVALYEYYSSEDVDKELLPLRRMFLDFAALQAEGVVAATARRNVATPWRQKGAGQRQYWRMAVAAAAVMLIIIGVGALAYGGNDEYEMTVYGRRCTDKEAVMGEVRHDMAGLGRSMPDVDGELKDAFGI